MTNPVPTPNVTAVSASPVVGLTLPSLSVLETLKRDIDVALTDVTNVLDFVEKYGSYVPGAGAVLGPLQLFDNALKVVKTLLDYA
jgi:hypothetical protein